MAGVSVVALMRNAMQAENQGLSTLNYIPVHTYALIQTLLTSKLRCIKVTTQYIKVSFFIR